MPYDGKLTKADGKGLWWDGLDPQELYAQNHSPAEVAMGLGSLQGRSMPDAAYMEKFFKRTKQLWDDYHPDQIYFDDDVLPFHRRSRMKWLEARRAFLQIASRHTAAPRR